VIDIDTDERTAVRAVKVLLKRLLRDLGIRCVGVKVDC